MREPITASGGHILTNGETYGRTIYLAEGMEASTFYEITEEEYNRIIEEFANFTWVAVPRDSANNNYIFGGGE